LSSDPICANSLPYAHQGLSEFVGTCACRAFSPVRIVIGIHEIKKASVQQQGTKVGMLFEFEV
jgi:hypothetical protein